MSRINLLFFLSIFWVQFAVAAGVELAAGSVSPYSGRFVPALVLGYKGESVSYRGFSSGVQNKLYYQSSYGLLAFKHWYSGELLGAAIFSGAGIGGLYSKRGFQDLDNNNIQEKHDFLLGPTFMVKVVYLDFIFFGIDAILGLRDLYRHLTLNFQDVVVFSIGVRI